MLWSSFAGANARAANPYTIPLSRTRTIVEQPGQSTQAPLKKILGLTMGPGQGPRDGPIHPWQSELHRRRPCVCTTTCLWSRGLWEQNFNSMYVAHLRLYYLSIQMKPCKTLEYSSWAITIIALENLSLDPGLLALTIGNVQALPCPCLLTSVIVSKVSVVY